MARLQTNLVTEGISGKLSNVVFKRYAYGTVVSKVPDRSKVQLSASQKNANKRFKEAVAFAKEVLKDPERSAEFEKVKKTEQSLYHAVLSSYLNKK